MTHKISFRDLTLSDRDCFVKKEKQLYIESPSMGFATNWLWKDTYKAKIAWMEDCLLLAYEVNGETWYAYPLHQEKAVRVLGVKCLQTICHQEGRSLCFWGITKTQRQELEEAFPGCFEIEPNRDIFDYVYSREKLATLAGKKLSSKRNHIHRFEEGGAWTYEALQRENLEECWELELEWLKRQEELNGEFEEALRKENQSELEAEKKALQRALVHFEKLKLFGGLIRREGKVVAFTIGERLNEDTLLVHFEKANSQMQGAYQIINQQFVLHHPEFTWVNREEDTGDMGLRKAKLSYYPEQLLVKHIVKESPFVYATKQDRETITELWKSCFGDSQKYIDFYWENKWQENNMLCLWQDGNIVSMTSIFPAVYKNYNGREEKQVLYLYAVATDPLYRGKGYAGQLITHILDTTGKPLILCAATEELEEFYQKLGFQKAFQKEEWTYQLQDIPTEPTEAEGYTFHTQVTPELTQRFLKSREICWEWKPYISWDEAHCGYALEECLFTGGKVLETPYGFLLYHILEKDIEIVECTISKEFREKVFAVLCQQEGKNRLQYWNKGGMLLCPSGKEQDMQELGYLSLTLG